MEKNFYIKVFLLNLIYFFKIARVARERDYLTKNSTNLHFF